jgi:hypothetical protein
MICHCSLTVLEVRLTEINYAINRNELSAMLGNDNLKFYQIQLQYDDFGRLRPSARGTSKCSVPAKRRICGKLNSFFLLFFYETCLQILKVFFLINRSANL